MIVFIWKKTESHWRQQRAWLLLQMDTTLFSPFWERERVMTSLRQNRGFLHDETLGLFTCLKCSSGIKSKVMLNRTPLSGKPNQTKLDIIDPKHVTKDDKHNLKLSCCSRGDFNCHYKGKVSIAPLPLLLVCPARREFFCLNRTRARERNNLIIELVLTRWATPGKAEYGQNYR